MLYTGKWPPQVGLVKSSPEVCISEMVQQVPTVHRETARLLRIRSRNDGFWRAPEIYFHYETKARKVMVDFKFDALYR